MNYNHGGDIKSLARRAGREAGDILDFSANINPLGPPDWLRDVISANVSGLVHYPDPTCSTLTAALAAKYGCDASEVIVGNGSSELLYMLPRAAGATRAVIPVPAYTDYESACVAAGLPVANVAMTEETDFALEPDILSDHISQGDIVFIGHPGNPTGVVSDAEGILKLAATNQDVLFVIDEAFFDFVRDAASFTLRRPANVVVIISFTKIFAIPGLRLGAAIADTEIVSRLRKLQPFWTVNSLAQAVGEKAIADSAFVEKTKEYVALRREELRADMDSIGRLHVFPGRANFLLVRIENGTITAPEIAKHTLKDGIAIRVCNNFRGLDDRYFRVAVRTEEENARLVEAIRRALGAKPRTGARRKTPALMFQATGSNAGKSILAAAMCRILLRDGFRVVPFKAQNMALNSFVTRDGGEMGRAQALQAQACRLDADIRMNPVLLKPNTDTGAQVIINGRPVGNMNVGGYIEYKPIAFDAVKKAYDSLASEYDVIVIEGAGSPAEINLKHHDIVNMNMARYAGAPVLLIGDIDRGGVFAAFVGTMETLAEWERKLVAGFVVNKFRGDASLLEPALEYTRRRTGRDVFGIVPFIERLGLPDEDSVSFKSGGSDLAGAPDGCVEVAVIDLPHISNFTDFDPFRIEPDVRLRIVRAADELREPDIVMIPGSKNVMGDIEFVRNSGIGEKIARLANGGRCMVIGVCAGLQILGKGIKDPHCLETKTGGETAGLGLLPLESVLEKEKILAQVEAVHLDSGMKVRGYEIHHGRMTTAGDAGPCVKRTDGEVIGVSVNDGMVWGTYLHGIFDDDLFRRWLIDSARTRKGMTPAEGSPAAYDLDAALDRLAAIVRESLDMERIYRLLRL